MNETKTTNESKKQKWIKAEHDKAVQIHWDNIERIKKLKDEQSTKIYRIYSYQIGYNKLIDQTKDKYELSIESIREQQLKHCLEVADLQKQIDKNPFDKSVQVMHKNSNEEMLSKKYDKLFNKKTNEVK
tara:strand:+ start:107 stop:493 length:387 start_codon:yes stop_codon:yes gene_type:complete